MSVEARWFMLSVGLICQAVIVWRAERARRQIELDTVPTLTARPW